MRATYPLSEVPAYCQMPPASHADGLGGCWGILHNHVANVGPAYCVDCEFCGTPADAALLVLANPAAQD